MDCLQDLWVSEEWGCLLKIAAGTIAGVAAVAVLLKQNARSREAKLRSLWDSRDKDVVTLHMFPRARTGPNPSPFPVKLETFLRMTGIK